MNWQPIGTAPANGRRILAWLPMNWQPIGACAIVRWSDDTPNGYSAGWMLDNGRAAYEHYNPPTHWMELPEPPAITEGATS